MVFSRLKLLSKKLNEAIKHIQRAKRAHFQTIAEKHIRLAKKKLDEALDVYK